MSKPVKQSDPEKFDVFPEQLELFDLDSSLARGLKQISEGKTVSLGSFAEYADSEDDDPVDQSIPAWEIEILGRDSDGR